MSAGRFAAELCRACGHAGIEPRGFCPRCGSRAIVVGKIGGEATVWSVTTIHRPPSRDGTATGPYDVGVVALAAGPRLMVRLPAGLAIGDAVTVIRATLDGETVVAPRR